MPSSRRPLVAYTILIEENPDGPRYSVYTDAYGLEMCIDDEWEVDTVLMSPPDLVDVITEETGVTSEATVFAGASSPPSDGDFAKLKSTGATFVLITELDDVKPAVDAGLRVVFAVTSTNNVQDAIATAGPGEIEFAVMVPDGVTPQEADAIASPIREILDGAGFQQARVILTAAGTSIDSSSICGFTELDNVDGVLLQNTSYSWVLELLNAIAEA